MEGKSRDMQLIFEELTEENKDIIILLAKTIKITQSTTQQSKKTYKK